MPVLRTRDLTKSYSGRTVVRGVNVEIESGEVVGLLGANGAGKTTTFSMVVGLTAPDSGRVLLDGHDVTDDPMATEAPPPGEPGWDISTVSALTWDSRSNWYGITKGTKLRVEYERSLPALGSTFDYWTITPSFEHAHVFFGSHNLDVRGRVGSGGDLGGLAADVRKLTAEAFALLEHGLAGYPARP